MRTALPTLVLLVAALAGPSAFAQGPAGGGGGNRGGMGGGSAFPSMPRPPAPLATSSPMIQVQLDQLEDELQLTKAQYPAWNRFAEKVASLMDDVRRAREPGGTLGGTASEQFDLLQTTARNRVSAVDEIAELGRALYATLTPEQKVLADRRLARLVAPAIGLPGTASTAAPAAAPGAGMPGGGSPAGQRR